MPSTLGLLLSFDHPSIDPSEISRALGVEASRAGMAGSHYVNVDGEELPARHRRSRWVLDREVATSSGDADWRSVLDDVLTMLERHADFVLSMADEGRVLIYFQLSGAEHRGIVLPSDVLQRMTKLNLAFGLEVFPSGLG